MFVDKSQVARAVNKDAHNIGRNLVDILFPAGNVSYLVLNRNIGNSSDAKALSREPPKVTESRKAKKKKKKKKEPGLLLTPV